MKHPIWNFRNAIVIAALTPCLSFARDGSGASRDVLMAANQPSDTITGSKTRPKASETLSPEEELATIVKTVGRLEERFKRLQNDYGDPTRLFTADELNRQFDEATYLYLIEDYQRAALLFYMILEKTNRQQFPNFDAAEYYLAESLLFAQNYAPALEYFGQIVEFGAQHRFYEQSVVYLVELYGKTGNFKRFSQNYESFIQGNPGLKPTKEMLYALGKAFYLQGNHSEALGVFEQLSREPGKFPHLAQYFIGVIHVVRRDFPAAIAAFETVLSLSVSTQEQREIEDLAYLALGRIYYETNEFSKALTYYQSISRDSSHFADALYEQTWTYIRKEDYEQAIGTIDILTLTFPDNINVPQLKLIRGTLQQKRKNYTEALDTYKKLVGEYSGIRDELERILREPRDILGYFNELVESDLSRIDASFIVPALAVRFATNEKEMSQALTISRALRREQRDLEEASRLLHDLEQEIYNNAPHNLLVGMRRARQGTNGLKDELLLAYERVIQCEFAFLYQSADESQKRQLDAWEQAQGGLGRLARQVPEFQRDQTELLEVQEDQVQAVQRNAFKLDSLIEDLLAQATAIEKYLSYSRESGAITLQVEQDARFQLSKEIDELQDYRSELAEVQTTLSSLDIKRQVALNSERDEDAFRKNAEERLKRQNSELAQMMPESSANAAVLVRASDARNRLNGLGEELGRFYMRLDDIEISQVNEIKLNLEREKTQLEANGLLAQRYASEIGNLSEEIARGSFGRIHGHFNDLILNADFGVTDVYWELAEEKSQEIESNQTQRADELKALYEKFSTLQDGDL